MRRLRCTRCGLTIMKSAFNDPYLCRECERNMKLSKNEKGLGNSENFQKPEERFAYLDS